MSPEGFKAALAGCYAGLKAGGQPRDLPVGARVYEGKVRDVAFYGDRAVLVASDRISAFDRVLSTVPWKGEVLTRISAWWFDHSADLVHNHLVPPSELGGYDPVSASGRCVVARRLDMLPVELVVRGYLSGSAWRDYQAGRPVSGLRLPGGLRYNERFPSPVVTPSTKEASGHDRPCSGAELVASGAMDADTWRELERTALALFARGQELAARRGLVLVDTKYEFGVYDGRLCLGDEIHTPDSSRYWYAEGYEGRFARGVEQRELDKEAFRRWLLARGFKGDGEPPAIPDELRIETAMRYAQAYEAIIGEEFKPVCPDAQAAERAAAYCLAEAFKAR